MRLNSLPRIRLASLPTPLQELPNLSKALKGPRIFVKRDDLTGLAFGGNKTRKLEYLMGEAVQQKADCIVTYAGFHSNWLTQAAAAARKLGMKIYMVKTGPREGYEPDEYDGNHLLHFLAGATMKVVRPEKMVPAAEEISAELRAAGRRPFILRDMGSTAPGVAGYINFIRELKSQISDLGLDPKYLVHTTGAGGTQAGLIIGAKAFNTGIRVIGSTSGSKTIGEQTPKVLSLMKESLQYLEMELKIGMEDIVIYDNYADGYGYATEKKAEAVKMLAEMEGLFLDPVYTASSMACLIDLARKGFFKKDEVVIFLHTGGSAALFAYKEPLRAFGEGKKMPWTIPPWSPDRH
ncbi:MAG: D-cysteine desulfhydrase family protein [Syntrophaceae bacterium]|nr:D-cysteine desulfhydrase family protein [Syntrophaceae bacterium]